MRIEIGIPQLRSCRPHGNIGCEARQRYSGSQPKNVSLASRELSLSYSWQDQILVSESALGAPVFYYPADRSNIIRRQVPKGVPAPFG